jgi:hypothetical protein
MANPQIFKTPCGEEFVILPRSEYDALVAGAGEDAEDAADISLFDERVAAYEAGHNPDLPEAVTESLRKGDSLLKALRDWRDMTQQHVAQRTGLPQGYISELEVHRKAGTMETLRKIAEALEIDPSWISPGQ